MTERCVLLKNVLHLVRFVFPNMPLYEGLPIILGTLKTMGVVVI
jgi:hypothetical protein